MKKLTGFSIATGMVFWLLSSHLQAGVGGSARDNPKVQEQFRRLGTTTLTPGLQRLLENSTQQSRALQGNVRPDNLAVELRGRITPELLDQLRGLAEVDFASEKYGSVSLRLNDLAVLTEIDKLPGVRSISLAEPKVRRVGAAESRAPVALRSNQLGLTGAGKRIGILSDSFALTSGVRDADTTPPAGVPGILQGSKNQDSGDLPAAVTIVQEGAVQQNAIGGVDEGAAMAELAYDVAPGVDLSFHTVGSSRAAFATAIDTLCLTADVLVDDIGFLQEPFYQDGIVAQAAANCVQSGVPFLSAIGNDGDHGFREIYKDVDTATDDMALVPTGVDLHDWGNGDPFLAVTVPAGKQVYAVLQWNQPNISISPLAGSQIDLDLYATRVASVAALSALSADYVAASTSQQGTTGLPAGDAVEYISLQAGASDTTFYISIDHFGGAQDFIPQSATTPVEFRLLFIGSIGAVEYPFNGPVAWGHPLAEGVISVGAVPWWESPDFAPNSFGNPGVDPEPYSSRGGNFPIMFDANGNFQNVSRFAPSLAAVDGNNNTFFGDDFNTSVLSSYGEPDGAPNFFGTSAAAPNAAALFALMLEAFPNLSPRELADGFIATAIDVTAGRAASGLDDVTGAGLIDASQAYAYLGNYVPTGSGTGKSGGGGGGCFIATAAYGSYWSGDVRLLREFRDKTLRHYAAGRWFIQQYYRYSPSLADLIRDNEPAKRTVRTALVPVIWAIRHPLYAWFLILGSSVLLPLLYRRTRAVA